MSVLFVSDLHLDAARPAITRTFLDLLAGEARQAQALYILGDLFEAWVGDDQAGDPAMPVCEALKGLAASGVAVFLMRGNRDFLYGPRIAERCGATLLPDPCVVTLYGEPVLLMHGDLLCTDDAPYQAFRRQVRDPAWQARFLDQPIEARLAFAAQARAASREHQGAMAETVGDVVDDEVAATMARYGVTKLIHGHTHRPRVHVFPVGERTATRIVLGDWYEQGSVLRVDPDGFSLSALG